MTISELCAAGRYADVARELAALAESGDKRALIAGLLDLAFDCGKLAQLRDEFARTPRVANER